MSENLPDKPDESIFDAQLLIEVGFGPHAGKHFYVDALHASMLLHELNKNPKYAKQIESGKELDPSYFSDARAMFIANKVAPDWISFTMTTELIARLGGYGDTLKKKCAITQMSPPSTE